MNSDWEFLENTIVATRNGGEYHLDASQLSGTDFPIAAPVLSALVRFDEFEPGYGHAHETARQRLVDTGIASDSGEADAMISYLGQTNRLTLTQTKCILCHEDVPTEANQHAAYNTWGVCIEAILDELEQLLTVAETKQAELHTQKQAADDDNEVEEALEQERSLSVHIANLQDTAGSLAVQRDRLSRLYHDETAIPDEELMGMFDHLSSVAAAVPGDLHVDEDTTVETVIQVAEKLSAVSSAVAGVDTVEGLSAETDTMEQAAEILQELDDSGVSE
jgi:phage shock protein A